MSERFPIRLHGRETLVVVRLPRPMGGGAKVFLRTIARDQLPELFHYSIVTGMAGRSDNGQQIPINTVGRWLFGVPGYMGHIRVFNGDEDLAKVEFPQDSPSIVHDLVNALKRIVEALPPGS